MHENVLPGIVTDSWRDVDGGYAHISGPFDERLAQTSMEVFFTNDFLDIGDHVHIIQTFYRDESIIGNNADTLIRKT